MSIGLDMHGGQEEIGEREYVPYKGGSCFLLSPANWCPAEIHVDHSQVFRSKLEIWIFVGYLPSLKGGIKTNLNMHR